MADPSIVFHVFPADRGGWQLTKEGRRSRIATFPSRDAAIARGRVEAAKSAQARLVVHGDDYVVQYEERLGSEVPAERPQA